MTILQIGDSHTAADFLTGQLRRSLQAEFGDGGAGYVVPGKPRSGVRSSAMKIEASSGWTYASLQAGREKSSRFALSGFEALATAAGETLTYSSEQPVSWDQIEVEVTKQPGGGAITISLDGKVESEFALDGPQTERVVVRLTPENTEIDHVRRIVVTTLSTAPVQIAGLAVRNTRSGVSVSPIGFPGATVDIVNKFDGTNLGQELKRLAPEVVLLAFGTNEGFNDNLDIASYTASYRRVVRRIRKAAPTARIVVMAPAHANRLPPGCRQEAAKAACVAAGSVREPATTASVAQLADDPGSKSCIWRSPPNLARVRDAQQKIAREEKLVFWNWADIMPGECGPHEWAKLTPPLMADDHVHMTVAGYRLSADRFLPVLRSVLGEIQGPRDALPHD